MKRIATLLDAVNASPIMFFVMDREGVIELMAGGALEAIGIAGESDVVGTSAFKLKAIPVKKAHFKRALDGEVLSVTYPAGERFYETTFIPRAARDGTIDQVTAFVTDVTVRVLTEQEMDDRVFQKQMEIKAIQRELREMLDNMKQAIVTFDADLEINEQYSKHLHTLFQVDAQPTGRNIIDFLWQDKPADDPVRQTLQFEMDHIFEADAFQWELSVHNYPTELKRDIGGEERTIKLSWEPIFSDDGQLSRVMVIMEDITELLVLAKDAEDRKAELEKIADLLAVDDNVFKTFTVEAARLLADSDMELAKLDHGSTAPQNFDVIGRLFRYVHTIKGTARLFRLTSIENVAHQVEDYFQKVLDGDVLFSASVVAELKSQMAFIRAEVDSYQKLRTSVLKRENSETETLSKGQAYWLRSVLNRLTSALHHPELNVRDTDAILFELRRAIASIGNVHLGDYIRRYDEMLDNLASTLDKKILPVTLAGDHLYISNRIMGRLSDIMVHCLRNAIDHGIESAAERVRVGKVEAGRITITSRLVDDHIELVIADDGRGIDRARIVEKATAKGIIAQGAERAMSDSEVLDLIFSPGFSTAEHVTDVSGRGVGMDAVREIAGDLDGSVELSSVAGRGTEIRIRIPHTGTQLISQMTVFDLKEEIRQVVTNFEPFLKRQKIMISFSENWDSELSLAYCDRLAVSQAFRQLVASLVNAMTHPATVTVSYQKLAGRRRIDSVAFFRFSLFLPEGFPDDSSFLKRFAKNSAHREISELLARVNGTLIISPERGIEINIPSNMPFAINQSTLHVLSIAGNDPELLGWVKGYFERNLNGVPVKLYQPRERDLFFKSVASERGIIIVDAAQAARDADLLERLARREFYVICITENAQDINPALLSGAGDNIFILGSPVSSLGVSQTVELVILQIFANHRREAIRAEEAKQKSAS